jgi:hypothetical protein
MNQSKYRPYDSDSDTGSESESDSSYTSSSSEGFKNETANLPLLASALAAGFSLIRLGGGFLYIFLATRLW